MQRGIYRFSVYLLAVVMTVGMPFAANSAADMNRAVQLTSGSASTVDFDQPIADVLVANPVIADVGTLRSNRLYIVGKTVGDTNVLAFDAAGNQLADIAVHVRVDEKNIRETIKKFFPKEEIEVRTVKSEIVLTGIVSTPAVANQVRDLAGRFITTQGQTVVDLMKVAGEQQVMLKVKVIEADRNILREYGFAPSYNGLNASPTTGAQLKPTGGQTGLVSLTPFASGSLFVTDGKAFGPFEESVNALEQDGVVNTLAEPTLTAISGETAGFLAGGEFPVPTGRDSSGNITIDFKQYGVALNFTPTVLAKDRISLVLSTEVSTKSTQDTVTLVNTVIPGLSVRRAETTVQMGSGGTLMIAGLLKSGDIHSLNGMPGIEDVPILGALFKSNSFSRNESELIVLVTPYVVQPYAEPDAENLSSAVKSGPVSLSMPAAGVKGPQGVAADPLSQTFMDNLRKVYGNKMPEKVTTGSSFGYIVD